MATRATPKPARPMTKLARKMTRAPAAHARVTRASYSAPARWRPPCTGMAGGGGMVTLGYKLSSEEFGPRELVRLARRAEDNGFGFALISDHFHPWTDAQGQSPFVWSVIGGLAEATSRLIVGTGVTCPTTRIHPAIIAQAAATSAAMLEGRFFLGVGTGENLNEHVVGARWPAVEVRQAMLEEAVGVMRQLWQGGYQDHHGLFYTVENARLYTLPERVPPVMVAAGGARSAELAGRIGDGLVAIDADPELVERFGAAGGGGGRVRPRRRPPSDEDPCVRRRRLRPRLHPPGGTGPGRLPALLRARGLAAARRRPPRGGVEARRMQRVEREEDGHGTLRCLW